MPSPQDIFWGLTNNLINHDLFDKPKPKSNSEKNMNAKKIKSFGTDPQNEEVNSSTSSW